LIFTTELNQQCINAFQLSLESCIETICIAIYKGYLTSLSLARQGLGITTTPSPVLGPHRYRWHWGDTLLWMDPDSYWWPGTHLHPPSSHSDTGMCVCLDRSLCIWPESKQE